MEQRRVNVAIVGCGRIGSQWDEANPSPAYSRTHAAAFGRQARASLVAVCDQDRAKAERAARIWGAPRAYTEARRLFADNAIELAVIAAASTVRWEVVEPALAAGVKVLVIEKPLAPTLAESRRLALAIKQAAAASLVNFSRRWDPCMRELRAAIRAGELGTIQRMVGIYGKGITNNGSHMIDLAGFLCDARPLRVRALGSPLDAGEASWSGGKDQTLDAQLVFSNDVRTEIQLTMLGTDQRAFTCFELRVIGSKALFDISRGGRAVTRTRIDEDPNYAGYLIPGTTEALEARALEAMDCMADEALRLAFGEIPAASCDAEAALLTATAVEAVHLSAAAHGTWTEISAIINDGYEGLS